MIRQFLSDVVWQDIDYLVIDTPPGTSDEHITVIESLKSYCPDGALLVTTPQVSSEKKTIQLKRCIRFLQSQLFLAKLPYVEA